MAERDSPPPIESWEEIFKMIKGNTVMLIHFRYMVTSRLTGPGIIEAYPGAVSIRSHAVPEDPKVLFHSEVSQYQIVDGRQIIHGQNILSRQVPGRGWDRRHPAFPEGHDTSGHVPGRRHEKERPGADQFLQIPTAIACAVGQVVDEDPFEGDPLRYKYPSHNVGNIAVSGHDDGGLGKPGMEAVRLKKAGDRVYIHVTADRLKGAGFRVPRHQDDMANRVRDPTVVDRWIPVLQAAEHQVGDRTGTESGKEGGPGSQQGDSRPSRSPSRKK